MSRGVGIQRQGKMHEGGLRALAEDLEAEVVALAGERDRREGGQQGLVRWGRHQGSVYLLDQKLLLTCTRVRDLQRKVEVPLRTYEHLREPRTADAGLFRTVLRGLSGHQYEACAEAVVPEACGLSASSSSTSSTRPCLVFTERWVCMPNMGHLQYRPVHCLPEIRS